MLGVSDQELDAGCPGRNGPRFVSPRRVVLTVVLGYIGLVSLVAVYLVLLEGFQAYNDGRNIDATVIYAVVMAFPFGRALRHPGRPHAHRLPRGALLGLAAGMAVTSLLTFVKFMNPISALGILLALTVAGMILVRRR